MCSGGSTWGRVAGMHASSTVGACPAQRQRHLHRQRLCRANVRTPQLLCPTPCSSLATPLLAWKNRRLPWGVTNDTSRISEAFWAVRYSRCSLLGSVCVAVAVSARGEARGRGCMGRRVRQAPVQQTKPARTTSQTVSAAAAAAAAVAIMQRLPLPSAIIFSTAALTDDLVVVALDGHHAIRGRAGVLAQRHNSITEKKKEEKTDWWVGRWVGWVGWDTGFPLLAALPSLSLSPSLPYVSPALAASITTRMVPSTAASTPRRFLSFFWRRSLTSTC